MISNSVKVWEETILIPTYGIGKPDKNPMFFENRVYQGSSGVVYPNPVIEKIYDKKEDKPYNGLFLENEYLKIMILPELGGRVQMAYDKIKERHFIYYNQVIKPALVGLTGPWISGGIEFNWPQHHRPSTFEPVDYRLEENADGSKTIWVNEVEQMFGTKGMAGFTLHPGKAYLEIKAQLYNRTPLPQTFLWWANPAVKVNDDYQSVFPPDVNAVFDHGKRDVSTFPIATGTYYKVDYSPGTDISRYKNIPVPTSYMAINSAYNFMGGYEHDTQAGVLHVANHHVSPGKKQWTWGHSDFGQAWDRNLTDEDGPYIELMAGVFTDNQPDFTWLMPYEEKSFTQYFLPYRELGVVKNASKDILLTINKDGQQANIKIQATSVQKSLTIRLTHADEILFEEKADLSPEKIHTRIITLNKAVDEQQLRLSIIDSNGIELISYSAADNVQNPIPEAAKPALAPEDVENTEQLFLTAQHLEQYRHATYSPVPYYEEALKRDPKDIRNNNALGLWYLRRGQFAKAEPYFRAAIATSISRNPNPYDGEPYYNLGLCLNYQGKYEAAYTAFYKSAWSNAWQDIAYFALAQTDLHKKDYIKALEHINYAIDRNARNSRAYHLKAIVLRKSGRLDDALNVCRQGLQRDAFNIGLLFEQHLTDKQKGTGSPLDKLLNLSRGTANNLIAYALDYTACGCYNEAIELLNLVNDKDASPMVYYYLAYNYHLINNNDKATAYLKQAAATNPYLCFPNRLEDIKVLQYAIKANVADARAPYYLGNLWYDKRQYADAILQWELSVTRDNTYPTVLRNLGIAAYNKQNDPKLALEYFERAYAADTTDARILMELDQLYKRLQKSPQERLKFLEKHLGTVLERDDVYLERAALYNFTGGHAKAFELIMQRQFHPWEGGEGKVSGQYLISLNEMAKQDIVNKQYQQALDKLQQARSYPHNLGEGKLFGAQENDIDYWTGVCYEQMGDAQQAQQYFTAAAGGKGELAAAMFYNDQQPDKIFYKGLALIKSGHAKEAENLFKSFVAYGQRNMDNDVKLDYFAVSLPDLLIFEDDLNIRNKAHCHYIMGLGYLGLQQPDKAAQEFNSVLQLDNMHFGAKIHAALHNTMSHKQGTISLVN